MAVDLKKLLKCVLFDDWSMEYLLFACLKDKCWSFQRTCESMHPVEK